MAFPNQAHEGICPSVSRGVWRRGQGMVNGLADQMRDGVSRVACRGSEFSHLRATKKDLRALKLHNLTYTAMYVYVKA